jgi:GntP family gluconate:H+ symporter
LVGPWLIALLVVAIIFIVLMTGKVRMDPFLVLILTALIVGLIAAIVTKTTPPLLDTKVDGKDVPGVIKVIASGFGNTMTSIGVVIVLGTIIGSILEKTGGALVLAQAMLRLVGKKNSPLAMNLAGYVVSIPVFCDSGFVILSPLNRALAASSGVSLGVLGTALSLGLYATHVMVPPTPGPIAAASNLGADLGMVILMGLLVALPTSIAGWIYATRVGRKYNIQPKNAESYDDLVKKYGNLPGVFESFLPIILPTILIALASIAALKGNPFGTGVVKNVLVFIGQPIFSLLIGAFLAMRLAPHMNSEVYGKWVGQALKDAAIILIVTGAGGSFGAILTATGIGNYLGATLAKIHLGIFLPFIIAAAIKTAQGSSTVSLVTTSAILAPMLESLGWASPMARVLVTLAIGAGSMVVSHANDSYFWVVSQFSDMDVNQAYALQTGGTAVTGAVGILTVALLSLFMI